MSKLTDIKVGDVFVDALYPQHLTIQGKFLKREIIVKEYFPSLQEFAMTFGKEIESEMSPEQKKAYLFALKCTHELDFYPHERDQIINSVVKTYLKEVLNYEIT